LSAEFGAIIEAHRDCGAVIMGVECASMRRGFSPIGRRVCGRCTGKILRLRGWALKMLDVKMTDVKLTGQDMKMQDIK